MSYESQHQEVTTGLVHALSVLIQNVNIMCISLLRENKGHHLAKQIPSLDTKDDPDLTHYPSFPN